MPSMPASASVLHMPSLTVVTPHYNEAVIYGKASAPRARLAHAQAPRGGVLEAPGTHERVDGRLELLLRVAWQAPAQRVRAVRGRVDEAREEGLAAQQARQALAVHGLRLAVAAGPQVLQHDALDLARGDRWGRHSARLLISSARAPALTSADEQSHSFSGR